MAIGGIQHNVVFRRQLYWKRSRWNTHFILLLASFSATTVQRRVKALESKGSFIDELSFSTVVDQPKTKEVKAMDSTHDHHYYFWIISNHGLPRASVHESNFSRPFQSGPAAAPPKESTTMLATTSLKKNKLQSPLSSIYAFSSVLHAADCK